MGNIKPTCAMVIEDHNKTASLVRNQLSLTRMLVDSLEHEIDRGSSGEDEAKQKLQIAKTALESTHTSLVSINNFLTKPIKQSCWTEGQEAPCLVR